LSYAAALAISQDPGRAYNPLFIYAGSGLGKTHLMHAIGHRARELHEGLRICYVTAEDFTYELVDSIQHPERMPAFRDKYRGVDLLLIDDIHFLIRKTQTQEAFFHTFNSLYEKGRQIVITSDRPPRDHQTMEDRLTSRFTWGLTTDIQPPDFETRLAIVRKKCEENRYRLSDEILQFVAEAVTTNVRDLEGCLTKVSAYSQFSIKTLNLEDAKRVLGDLIKRPFGQGPQMNEIIKAVCNYFSVSEGELVGTSRKACYVLPRQTAIWLIRELTQRSLMDIGDRIGGRDHSTILHSIQRCQYRQKEDPEYAAAVKRLKIKLSGIED
jgi:chromosomal replication initiator protein